MLPESTPTSLRPAAERATRRRGPTPTFQAGALAFASGVIVVGVMGLLWRAYPRPRPYPALFWIPELSLFVVVGFGCWLDVGLQWLHGIRQWFARLTDRAYGSGDEDPADPSVDTDETEANNEGSLHLVPSTAAADEPYHLPPLVESWVRKRDDVFRFINVPLGLVEVFAVSWLVAKTGGTITSPFLALLSAIAIFGPSLARRPMTVWTVVVPVGVAVVALTHFHYAATTPSKWVYTAVIVGPMFLAGFLNWLSLRHQRR